MPFNLSTGEIIVLLVVAVLVFGGRLPEVARKVARGIGDFRRGMNEEMRRIDAHTRIDDEPPPDWTPPPPGAECDGFGNVKPDDEVEQGEAEQGGRAEEDASAATGASGEPGEEKEEEAAKES